MEPKLEPRTTFCPRCHSTDITLDKSELVKSQYGMMYSVCNRCHTRLPEFPSISKRKLPELRNLKEVQQEIQQELQDKQLQEEREYKNYYDIEYNHKKSIAKIGLYAMVVLLFYIVITLLKHLF